MGLAVNKRTRHVLNLTSANALLIEPKRRTAKEGSSGPENGRHNGDEDLLDHGALLPISRDSYSEP